MHRHQTGAVTVLGHDVLDENTEAPARDRTNCPNVVVLHPGTAPEPCYPSIHCGVPSPVIDTAQVIALGVVYAMFAVLFKGTEESDRNSPAMDVRRGWVFSFLSSCFSGYSWPESSARNSRRSVRLTHRVPPIIVRDPSGKKRPAPCKRRVATQSKAPVSG